MRNLRVGIVVLIILVTSGILFGGCSSASEKSVISLQDYNKVQSELEGVQDELASLKREKDSQTETTSSAKAKQYDEAVIYNAVFDKIYKEKYSEIYEKVYAKVYKESYNGIYDVIYKESHNDIYDKVYDKIYNDSHDEIVDDIRKDIYDDVYEELKKEMARRYPWYPDYPPYPPRHR